MRSHIPLFLFICFVLFSPSSMNINVLVERRPSFPPINSYAASINFIATRGATRMTSAVYKRRMDVTTVTSRNVQLLVS